MNKRTMYVVTRLGELKPGLSSRDVQSEVHRIVTESCLPPAIAERGVISTTSSNPRLDRRFQQLQEEMRGRIDPDKVFYRPNDYERAHGEHAHLYLRLIAERNALPLGPARRDAQQRIIDTDTELHQQELDKQAQQAEVEARALHDALRQAESEIYPVMTFMEGVRTYDQLDETGRKIMQRTAQIIAERTAEAG